MKAITITLNNKQYTAKMNLATRLTCKREFGKNLEEFNYDEEESSYKVLHSSLKANNPKTYKLSFEEFLVEAPMTILLQMAELMTVESAPTESPEAGNVQAANSSTH